MTIVQKTWFITGSSRGFGRLIAEAALSRGDRAILTARRSEDLADLVAQYPEQARAFALDVTDTAAIAPVVAQAEAAFGGIDLLVNNAGYGLFGAVEEASADEYRRLFDTNVFGLVEVTRAVLPGLRARRRGHIINLSSVAGFTARAGVGFYSASKFAVEALSEAQAQELRPLGIHVTIVEPGAFRTDFLGPSLVLSAQRLADYEPTSGVNRDAALARSGHQINDPRLAALALFDLSRLEEPPLRLPLGRDALERIRDKLAQVAAEIGRWEHVTVATGFAADPPPAA